MRVLGLCAVLALALATAGCGSSTASASPTPTPGASGGVTGGAGVAGGGGNNGGGGNGGGAGSQSSAPSDAPPSSEPSASSTTGPAPYAGPYAVDQAVADWHVTGVVCTLNRPFTLSVAGSRVSFVIAFTPTDAQTGAVSYAYTIPSAGESDTGTGTYGISGPTAATGVLKLALKVSQHTVFKGFDGKIPVRQTLSLKPQPAGPCP